MPRVNRRAVRSGLLLIRRVPQNVVKRAVFGAGAEEEFTNRIAHTIPRIIQLSIFQLGSLAPSASQVFDDSVIHIRKNRTAMGVLLKRIVSVLPFPSVTVPCGKVCQTPRVTALMGSSPVQYWTT